MEPNVQSRWEAWVYRWGNDIDGKIVPFVVNPEEYEMLDPAIKTALHITQSVLRLDSPNGEPLTFMEYEKRRENNASMTIYFEHRALLNLL